MATPEFEPPPEPFPGPTIPPQPQPPLPPGEPPAPKPGDPIPAGDGGLEDPRRLPGPDVLTPEDVGRLSVEPLNGPTEASNDDSPAEPGGPVG